ncbi:hypothetical protein ACFVMC_29065 [Nocardia sp. NPDC127579]|uniref:hypothetical protein n=1 Tax=Nocardia sp. NPDC127579 TaxID=3345402 RepID=UPI00362752CE
MVQPTPWHKTKLLQAQGITASSGPPGKQRAHERALAVAAALRPRMGAARGNWGYLCAAACNCTTFFALFQPWISASSTDGKVEANPFGKIDISNTLVALWASNPPPAAKVNGTWAVLACVAIAVTVVVAVVNLRAPTRALSRAMLMASLAIPTCVAFSLIHLNRQAPVIRNMVSNAGPRDPGSVAGMLIRWATGQSNYALPGVKRYTWTTIGLTSWAWFAGTMAVFAAVAVLAQWARNRLSDRAPEPPRVSLIKTVP